MLYSVEKINFNGTERDIYLYLKKTRNHSYRITASKISLTLPNIYKSAEIIETHKLSLLQKINERITQQPDLIPKMRLLDLDYLPIYTDKIALVDNENTAQFNYDTIRKIIHLNKLDPKHKAKLIRKIIDLYMSEINLRVRSINQITVQKPIQVVELKNNHSTWGLCSSRGVITISVNTLFAPIWVLDYVIVHELCHLVHHDHSTRFWDLVERFYPKYKLAKKYLKEKGMELII